MQTPEHKLDSGRQDPGYQGLKAKATTCPGSPGHALNKMQLPAWPPSSYPIPMAPSRSKGKLQGGPSGQEWGYWTLRFSLTPPLSLSQQGHRQTAGCHMFKTAIRAEAGPWAQGKLYFGLAECLQAWCFLPTLPGTCVKPSAWPHHLVRTYCSRSPVPMGSSRRFPSHVPHIVSFRGFTPVSTSFAHALLWAGAGIW